MVNLIGSTFIIIFSTICSVNLFAGAQEELFLQANHAYQQSDFQTALKLYDSINHKGTAVYYNMALASYYLKQESQSLAYLHHALRSAHSTDFWKIKNTRKLIKPLSSWSSTFWDFLEFCTVFLSHFNWQLMILIVWYATIIIGVLLKKYQKNRIPIWWNGICMILFLLYRTNDNLLSKKHAIIKDTGATLYAGPHVDFSSKEKIGATEDVIVLQEKNSWYKVRYGSTKGWLQANDVIIC